MVSVDKMTTFLEEYTTEEQRPVVRFCGQNDVMQRIFLKVTYLRWEVFVA
jgi:hypothetical protein